MNRLKGDYNFCRIAHDDEKSWDDVVSRFINELVNRGAKTPKEDLVWLCGNFICLPNSPALLTASSKKFYASACSSYVIQDTMFDGPFSISSILNIANRATVAGIGCGYSFSNLRSKEEAVRGKVGLTGGPVSFMKSYDGFLKNITQATRKSANMGTLHVNHPDITDFINAKLTDGDLSCFNISVLLDDKFMKAVEKDGEYEQFYKTQKEPKKIKARELFNLIAENIYKGGEPGAIFIDTIKNDYFEDMQDNEFCFNPCSEAILTSKNDPLDTYLELCCLASINLPRFMNLSVSHQQKAVSIAVSMLNDIIDTQNYISDYQQTGMRFRNRKIGLGICGLHTVLATKAIKYSSDEAFDFTKLVFKNIGKWAKEASEKLYNDNLDKDGILWVHGNDVQDIALNKASPLYTLKRYNASLLSVAPTSTLSNIFADINEEGCSYGIESYFSITPYVVNNSYGKFEVKEKIVGILGEEKAKELIECANDLDWKSHLMIVEAYYSANEKGIVQGCSKTLNFKNQVSVGNIKEALVYCWKNKIKAISMYRDNSRANQVIQTKDVSTKETYQDCVELDAKGRPVDLFLHQSPKRPEYLDCEIHHVQSESKKWLVCIGLFKGKPYEVFAGEEENISIPKKYKIGKIKKNGGYHLIVGEGDDELIIKDMPTAFKNAQYASLTRIISFSLRHGGPLKFVVEQLLKEGGFDAFNKAIARCLKKYIKDNEDVKMKCPECGGDMKYVSGCPCCMSCKYTKCS